VYLYQNQPVFPLRSFWPLTLQVLGVAGEDTSTRFASHPPLANHNHPTIQSNPHRHDQAPPTCVLVLLGYTTLYRSNFFMTRLTAHFLIREVTNILYFQKHFLRILIFFTPNTALKTKQSSKTFYRVPYTKDEMFNEIIGLFYSRTAWWKSWWKYCRFKEPLS